MKRDVKAIISKMSLEQKTRLCGGEDHWHLRGFEELGIPVVRFADGPHGLRKQMKAFDHLGIHESNKAVCFPSACAFSATFDKELIGELGSAIGEECQAEDISVILGPAVNIKRSPLCGRNFEYLSEDPYVVGELAASYVNGVQKHHVGTSPKHFAANNAEYFRTTNSSEIDERTYREIYLAGFETLVKKGRPWTMMTSYNRINGLHTSENEQLLTTILRDEWGFDGFVMSDWYAVHDRVKALKAGLDLEMPYSLGHNDKALLEAAKSGELPMEVLDKAVERILNKVFEFADNRQPANGFDREAHHALAARIASEGAVLLKNDNQVLPLRQGVKAAFIGSFAETPRYQGGGSSHINPFKIVGAMEAARGIEGIEYVPAFPADSDCLSEEGLAAAVAAARAAAVAVIFAGLPDLFESEGYDREHLHLPEGQNRLIHEVAKVQPNTVVVLHNGSPVIMPWIDEVASVLEMYLGGQAVGQAEIALLYGKANPCGKLAETFPKKLADNPSYLNFPGTPEKTEYKEGVFVGYRYYDYKEMDVLFPFGHGLSYTSFQYRNLKTSSEALSDQEFLTVTAEITNSGAVPGKEVVQLYVGDHTKSAIRPIRELKGFEKLSLNPGETKTVEFVLDKRAFAYYHEGLGEWHCAGGEYEIFLGASSRDLRLRTAVTVASTSKLPFRVDLNTTMFALLSDPRTKALAESEIIDKYDQQVQKKSEMSVSSAAIDAKRRAVGRMERPLRNLYMIQGVAYEEVLALIEKFNKLLNK